MPENIFVCQKNSCFGRKIENREAKNGNFQFGRLLLPLISYSSHCRSDPEKPEKPNLTKIGNGLKERLKFNLSEVCDVSVVFSAIADSRTENLWFKNHFFGFPLSELEKDQRDKMVLENDFLNSFSFHHSPGAHKF